MNKRGVAEDLSHITYDPVISQKVWSDRTVTSICGLINYACSMDNRSTADFSNLDVGCGRGELLRAASDLGCAVVGLDMDPNCIEMSGRFAECIQADANRLSQVIENKSFDVVVLSHILEHLPDPGSVIREAKAISKRWIIVSVPNLCSSAVVLNNIIGRRSSMKAHLFGWDSSHFFNFLEYHCNLEVIRMDTGWVKVFPIDLFASSLPSYLASGMYAVSHFLEAHVLAPMFPRFASNLTALVRIAD